MPSCGGRANGPSKPVRPAHLDFDRERQDVRFRTIGPLRHPGSHLGADTTRDAAFPGQRPADPDPRRRLGAGHVAAASTEREAAGGNPLRPGHEPEHHPARGQDRGGRVLRTSPIEKGIMVMAGWCCCDYWEQMGQVEATSITTIASGVDARPDPAHAQPSRAVSRG